VAEGEADCDELLLDEGDADADSDTDTDELADADGDMLIEPDEEALALAEEEALADGTAPTRHAFTDTLPVIPAPPAASVTLSSALTELLMGGENGKKPVPPLVTSTLNTVVVPSLMRMFPPVGSPS